MIGFTGIFDTVRVTTLYNSLLQSRLHYPLLGSGFQWRTFPFHWVPELSTASATSFPQQQLTTEPQQLSDSLINSVTHHPIQLISIDCLLTHSLLKDRLLTNCHAYNISARTVQKTQLQYCYAIAVETCLFPKPLLSIGCYIAAAFAVIA
jgi:hypothetical protein